VKYLYYGFVAFFIYLLASGVQEQFFKETANAKRLDCQKEVVSFEALKDEVLIIEAKKALLSKNYDINSTIEKSEYMKTKLFEFVKKDEIDTILKSKIDKLATQNEKTDKLEIRYNIKENDKLHPGKKSPKSKLFMGYLTFEFYLKNKRVYEFQIDFMQEKGEDIPKRLDCTLKAFLSI